MRPKKTWEAGIVGQTGIGTGTRTLTFLVLVGVQKELPQLVQHAAETFQDRGGCTARVQSHYAKQQAPPSPHPRGKKSLPHSIAHFGLRALKVTGAFVKVDPDPRPCLVIGGLRPVVTSYPFDDLEGKGQEIWVQRWVPIEATKESLSWSADRWAESCSSSLESASSSSCVCCSHKRESGSDYARCYGWAEFKLTQFQ